LYQSIEIIIIIIIIIMEKSLKQTEQNEEL